MLLLPTSFCGSILGLIFFNIVMMCSLSSEICALCLVFLYQNYYVYEHSVLLLYLSHHYNLELNFNHYFRCFKLEF